MTGVGYTDVEKGIQICNINLHDKLNSTCGVVQENVKRAKHLTAPNRDTDISDVVGD